MVRKSSDDLSELFSELLEALVSPSVPVRDGSLPPPRRATFVTEAFSTAVHEAGHAVAAWSSTHVTSLTEVTIQGKSPDQAGLTSYNFINRGTDTLWALVTIGLAGMAAEGIVIGSVRSKGGERDLLNAQRDAKRIMRHGPQTAMDIPWALNFQDPTRTDIGRLYATRPDPVTCGILNACYRKARHVIKCHRQTVDALILALMRQRTLSSRELDSVLGVRLLQVVHHGARPVFFLP